MECTWINGLGETCESVVYAEFTSDNKQFVVVLDWREAMRGDGFIVLPREVVTFVWAGD